MTTTALAKQGISQSTDVDQRGKELATTKDAASAQHEIQSAITIAKHFPRNEDQCFQSLMKAASRPSFAEDATYSFPRGDAQVTGPSVNLAREAGRIWGNIRYGLSIIRDDESSRLIRGWAWDVENNTKVEMEDDFQKTIQRKDKKTGETRWIICTDERELRELTNRRGAILQRNAILQVLPKDLIEDALFRCAETLTKAAGENPEGVRKRLLVDFAGVNVTVEQIEQKLGHPFAQASAKQIAELRGICKSIQDGNSTWAEYVKGPEAKPAEPTTPAETQKMDDIRDQLKNGGALVTKEPVPADLKEPLDKPVPGVDEVTWKEFITYVDDNLERAKLKKVMKERMGIGNLGQLRSADRLAFILSCQDEAKRRGLPFETFCKG